MDDQDIYNIVKSKVTILTDGIIYQDFRLTEYPVFIYVKHAGKNYWDVWQFTWFEVFINDKLFRKFYDYSQLLRWIVFYLRIKGDNKL